MAKMSEVMERAKRRRDTVVRRHCEDGTPLAQIAEEWGVSRQAIHKLFCDAQSRGEVPMGFSHGAS